MNLNEYLKQPGSLTVKQLQQLIGAKSEAQIRQWQHGYEGRRPGAEYCVAIERATKGQVTCEELRPDVDWAYLRGTSRTNRKQSRAAPELTTE